jgi:hypothetical protein
MSFATEQELVDRAIEYLPIRLWLKMPADAMLFQRTEVQGLFGIPDLLAVHAPCPWKKRCRVLPSIAFEMKLSDWRRGLAQAFRYRSFATVSFLVLDNTRAKSAVANADRFKRANVGLIGINVDGSFEVYVWPEKEVPFSAHLHSALAEIVRSETDTAS